MKHKNSRQSSAEPPSSAKRRLLLAFLALGSTAAALVLAETWARHAFKKNVEQLAFSESDLYYYYDPAGYRHNVPNKIGYERRWDGQGKVEFRINSLGFRGKEIPLDKPAGVFRVLFLGDSITLGGRLPEEDTFVSRVAQSLEASASPRYEIANAGVGDVGLVEEEQTLKTAGIRIHPDLVVLCWYLNDARPPVGFPEEIVYKNPVIRWFNRQAWLKKSYLAGVLYSRMRDTLVRRQLHVMDAENRRNEWIPAYEAMTWAKNLDEFLKVVHLARFDWGDGWNDRSLSWMADAIVRLRDFSRSRGIRFAVVMMPVHAQVYAEFASTLIDRPQRELGQRLDAAGIPYLNLLPILKEHAHERPFYDQCHYNPHGNQLVADAILNYLKKSAPLKP